MSIERIKDCSSAQCLTSNDAMQVPSSASSMFQNQSKPSEGLIISNGSFNPQEIIDKKCSVFVSLPGGCNHD